VYSAYDHFLARQVVAAAGKRSGEGGSVREAVEVLRHWNGQMDKDEAAPMITELLSNQMGTTLVTALLQPAMLNAAQRQLKSQPQNTVTKNGEHAGKPLAARGPTVPDILPRPQILEGLLRTRPSGWVARDDWDQWLFGNLKQALEEGRRRQGSPVSKWKWGRMMQWNLTHPVGKQLPLVNGFFNIGSVEMSGAGTTVKQTTGTLGPSERMVVDLGELDKSVQNLPVGESGMVASKHYKDQWQAYYTGKSFPMEFEHVDARDVLRVRPGRP
jgi:penicillin amidase